MPVNLGNKRAGVGVIVLDDEDDWTLILPPLGAAEWPDGTTAWIRFTSILGDTLEIPAEATTAALTFSMQYDSGDVRPSDIPDDGCDFKIRVTLPGDPPTRATLWRGRVEKEPYRGTV